MTPPYFLLNRIQGDGPAQWDGRQRLLPAEGLETHTTAVCGPSVEEVADSQTEPERVLCSGEMCWRLPSWTTDSWASEMECNCGQDTDTGTTLTLVSKLLLFLALWSSAGQRFP